MEISCNEQFHPCTTGTSLSFQQAHIQFNMTYGPVLLFSRTTPFNIATFRLLPLVLIALGIFPGIHPVFSFLLQTASSCHYLCNVLFSRGPQKVFAQVQTCGVWLVQHLCCWKGLTLEHKHSVVHLSLVFSLRGPDVLLMLVLPLTTLLPSNAHRCVCVSSFICTQSHPCLILLHTIHRTRHTSVPELCVCMSPSVCFFSNCMLCTAKVTSVNQSRPGDVTYS